MWYHGKWSGMCAQLVHSRPLLQMYFVKLLLCTLATCHEKYSMTPNPSVNHPSTRTIYEHTHSSKSFPPFTRLVIASVAHAKSHWSLPSLVSQGGGTIWGEKTPIDSGGPRAAQGPPLTWQGINIHCFRLRVNCPHEALEFLVCLQLQDHRDA